MFTAQLNDGVVVRVVVGSIISTYADMGGIIAAPVTPDRQPKGRILTELDGLLNGGENPYTAHLVGDTHHGDISHLSLADINHHPDMPEQVMFYFDHGMRGTIRSLVKTVLEAADEAEFGRIVLPLPEPRFNPETNRRDSLWSTIDRTTRVIKDFADQRPKNLRHITLVVPLDESLSSQSIQQVAKAWLHA